MRPSAEHFPASRALLCICWNGHLSVGDCGSSNHVLRVGVLALGGPEGTWFPPSSGCTCLHGHRGISSLRGEECGGARRQVMQWWRCRGTGASKCFQPSLWGNTEASIPILDHIPLARAGREVWQHLPGKGGEWAAGMCTE